MVTTPPQQLCQNWHQQPIEKQSIHLIQRQAQCLTYHRQQNRVIEVHENR